VSSGVAPPSQESGLPSIRRVVGVSLAVDVLDIVSNLIVALVTGSAVIFAEMAQGIADGIGSLLLVIGERRSRLPRDARYPSGHTREVFFWALMSAMVMLVVGGGLSLWRGYGQLIRLEPLDHPYLALAILVVSVTTNGYAVSQSVRRLRASGASLLQAFRDESQPLVKTAFLQDTLGTVGLISLLLYAFLGSVAFFDALGAILIACLMAVFAVALIVQIHHLIAGRPAPRAVQAAIRAGALSVPEVEAINALTATFAGSTDVVVDLDLDLKDDLTTSDIEGVLDRIRDAIVAAEPRVSRLRVDLNSSAARVRGER
jgi:cation diffusion facilitator family transporter